MSNDAVTPTNAALKAAGKVRRATVHNHEGGHFAPPYVEPLFSEIVEEKLVSVPAKKFRLKIWHKVLARINTYIECVV